MCTYFESSGVSDWVLDKDCIRELRCFIIFWGEGDSTDKLHTEDGEHIVFHCLAHARARAHLNTPTRWEGLDRQIWVQGIEGAAAHGMR